MMRTVRNSIPFALLAPLVVVFLLIGAAHGQESVPPDEAKYQKAAAAWRTVLANIREELKTTTVAEDRLDQLRTVVTSTAEEVSAARNVAREKRVSVQTELTKLGPPPKAGAPAESEEIAQTRSKLTKALARIEGRIRLADLLLTRASDLQRAIRAERREGAAKRLGQRWPSPLAPSTWRKGLPDLAKVYGTILRSPIAWWNSPPIKERREEHPIPVFLIAAVAGSVLLGWLLQAWLLRRYGRDPKTRDPSYARRLLGAVAEGAARGLIPGLVAGAILLVFTLQGVRVGLFAQVVEFALGAVFAIALITGFAKATLAPARPQWRLIPFTLDAGRLLYDRIVILAAVFSLDILLGGPAETVRRLPESSSIYTLVFAFAYAGALLALLPGKLWSFERKEDAEKPGRRRSRGGVVRFHLIRLLIGVTVVSIPICAMAGYGELSEFLRVSLMLTGLLIVLVVLIHGLVREASVVLLEGDSALAEKVRARLGIPKESGRILRFWTVFLFDVLLAIVFVAMMMRILGTPWADVFSNLSRIFDGVKVGKYTFSLGDVFIAIFVFVALWWLTKRLQHLLETKVFPQTRLRHDLRDTLSTIFGYVGIALAVIIAISSIGIDLSSLAVIFGALSVGIGFGVRNIVGNFVSGLNLLFERPIKAGDWIQVQGQEGIVKKVAVRATEIQTFQEASVLIPNLLLLENPVVNLTHKNKSGRIDIPIGVAYGSDTAKVRDILLKIASEHELIKENPAPNVMFLAHGESSLDFQLRAHTADVNNRLTIASDLRFAIDAAFRKAKIEIPFPQRDLHLRSDATKPKPATRSAAPKRGTRSGAANPKGGARG